MSRRMMTAFACAVLVMAAAVTAAAQTTDPTADEAGAAAEPTSAIKRISISLFGGYNSGGTFYELPEMDERAQLAENSNLVYLFDGTTENIGEELTADGLTAPKKEIDSGNTYGGKIGFYLSDSFHVDLVGSISKGDAQLTALRLDDWEPVGRELLDVDEKFTMYMGGIGLTYDAHNLKILGLTPYFGLGLGGVINRFDTLEDKTSLYFQFIGGLSHPLFSSDFWLDVGMRATTFSFETEEQEYSEQFTNVQLTAGLTLLFDVKPIYDWD